MDDPVVTNPDLYATVFENDRVRVLRYFDRPGERTQPHDHPDSVMITLSSFDRRLHHEGGQADVHLTKALFAGSMPNVMPVRTSVKAIPKFSSWS